MECNPVTSFLPKCFPVTFQLIRFTHLGLIEPSSWLVHPREACYDLDNIQLEQRGIEVL